MLLVVEDDRATREVLRIYFTVRNIPCDTAAGVPEAISKVSKKMPDILLADLILLDGDAKEIIRFCQGMSPGVKIILMSACWPGEIDDMIRGVKVDYIIRKPFDFDLLEDVIGRIRNVQ